MTNCFSGKKKTEENKQIKKQRWPNSKISSMKEIIVKTNRKTEVRNIYIYFILGQVSAAFLSPSKAALSFLLHVDEVCSRALTPPQN